MTVISILAMISMLVLFIFYGKVSFSTSLYIVSIFSITTYAGVQHSIGFIFNFFALMLLIYCSRIYFKKKTITYIYVLSVANFVIIFLSLNNGAVFVLNFLKFAQVSVLFLSIIVLHPISRTVSIMQMERCIVSIIVVNLFFGFFAHIFFNPYDEGMIRFSGIFFDANYFSLYLLLFYYALELFKSSGYMKLCVAILLCLTLSASAIGLLFIYILLKKVLPKIFLSRAYLFIISLSSVGVYMSIIFWLQSLSQNKVEGNFLIYKMVSLSQRVNVQIKAWDMLKSSDAFIVGFGSGRNLELTGKALHNSYIQMIFSHGFLYLLSVISMLCIFVWLGRSKMCNEDERCYFAIVYTFIIAGFVLDPLMSFYFNILFLFSYVGANNRIYNNS